MIGLAILMSLSTALLSLLMFLCAGVAAAAGEVAKNVKHLAIVERQEVTYSISCGMFWGLDMFCFGSSSFCC